jgi:NAD(P)H-hydrate epimerase
MTTHQLLSAEQMAKADQATIKAGVPAETLMEHAAQAVTDEIVRCFAARPVVVLAGPGNNGGDGFAVARQLAARGYKVTVAALAMPADLKGESARMAKAFKGKTVPLSAAALEGAALVVDALFGTGLRRGLEGKAAEVAEALALLKIPVVAVDIASGVNGTTGAVQGVAIKACLTVTFERKKLGHVLLPGKSFAGEVVVRSIGMKADVFEGFPAVLENHPGLWLPRFPWPRPEGHKYHRGYAAVVGGDVPSTGAARLAALAALRTGAGLVSVICPPQALPVYAASLTSVMTKPMKDIKAFEQFLDEPHRDGVLIGPGSGVSARTRSFAQAALKRHKKVVLDADALTVFEAMPERLFAAIRASTAPVVLTPHHAEFRRVFDTLSGHSKVELALKAAKLSGATVLLKGNDTVIASPQGKVAVNTHAPATLATAGAGDVLAGMILALLVMGMDGFDAAAAAAWMHGEAARQFGPGLIAEDLPGLLPGVLQRLFKESL